LWGVETPGGSKARPYNNVPDSFTFCTLMTEQDDTDRAHVTKARESGQSDGDEGARGPVLTPSVAQYAVAGMQFAAGVLIFLYLGEWLDRRLGTTPWLVMAGTFVGAAAGFFALYRKLTNDRKRIAARRLHHSAHQ
jgi:F0F1-type ATP synthase assembly protein I